MPQNVNSFSLQGANREERNKGEEKKISLTNPNRKAISKMAGAYRTYGPDLSHGLSKCSFHYILSIKQTNFVTDATAENLK